MRILFITSNSFLPEHACGQNRTILELSRRLVTLGHQPVVLSASHELQAPGGVVQERSLGFPLIRALDPLQALPAATLALRPDVLVVYDGDLQALCEACLPLKLPLVVWFFQAEPHYFEDTDAPAEAAYLATSAFLAHRAERLFGISVAQQPPYVEQQNYSGPANGKQVLFVNPVREKGVELLFELARQRSELPFTVVESWGLSAAWRKRCFQKSMLCGNIEWIPRSQDMSTHYRRARVLLMPRYSEEGFGRLVSEAQAAGIPVLASDRGNLPENVGEGGVCLSMDAPLERWLEQLDALYGDPGLHQTLSLKARQHSQREAMAPDQVAERFLSHIQRMLQDHTLSRYQLP